MMDKIPIAIWFVRSHYEVLHIAYDFRRDSVDIAGRGHAVMSRPVAVDTIATIFAVR